MGTALLLLHAKCSKYWEKPLFKEVVNTTANNAVLEQHGYPVGELQLPCMHLFTNRSKSPQVGLFSSYAAKVLVLKKGWWDRNA